MIVAECGDSSLGGFGGRNDYLHLWPMLFELRGVDAGWFVPFHLDNPKNRLLL